MPTTSSTTKLCPWDTATWQRWSARPRRSIAPIPKSKFLQIKIPAETLYDTRYGGSKAQYTVEMFMTQMQLKGTPVGLAVDCSSYDWDSFASASSSSASSSSDSTPSPSPCHFHDTTEWDTFDADYLSLPTQPAQSSSSSNIIIPSSATTSWFITSTSAHFASNPHTHVAVFDCSFGPAPFLMAAYLIVVLKAPVHVAVASVCWKIDTTTDQPLYQYELLHALQTRYKGTVPLTVPARPAFAPPATPPCALSTTLTVVAPYTPPADGFAPPPPTLPQASRKAAAQISLNTARDKRQKLLPTPTLVLPTSKQFRRVQTVLNEIGHAAAAKIHTKLPPGAWPGLSYSTCTLEDLANNPLKATALTSYRPSGRPGLLLLLTDGVFFIEDKPVTNATSATKVTKPLPPPAAGSGVSSIPINAPTNTITITHIPHLHIPTPTAPAKPQHRTLLDCIWVKDVDKVAHATKDTLLLVDIIAHAGGLLAHKPFSHRAQFLHAGLLKPLSTDVTHKHDDDPVKVTSLSMFNLDKFEYLTDTYVGGRQHGTSGLLFVDVEAKYNVGGKSEGVRVWEKEADVLLKEAVKKTLS